MKVWVNGGVVSMVMWVNGCVGQWRCGLMEVWVNGGMGQ